jgi:hypothetical protein
MLAIVMITSAAALLALAAWSLARSSDEHYGNVDEEMSQQRIRRELLDINRHRPDHIAHGADKKEP